jgi:threonine dehydrogenase-like Zn-dependent dehydrogenase
VPGHEFVGHVAAIGLGVSRVRVDDRVVIEPNYSCGACPLCREGNRNLCLARTAVGIDVDGCFAEVARVPERCCWPAPAGVADEDLLMTEPLAVVVRAVARATVRAGESAAVVGGGTLGLLALQVLRGRGAHVLLVSRSSRRFPLARELGAAASSRRGRRPPGERGGHVLRSRGRRRGDRDRRHARGRVARADARAAGAGGSCSQGLGRTSRPR